MSKAGKKIIAGLRDALAHAKGVRSGVKEHTIRVPVINVKELRNELGMSQPEFALRFGFPLGTLRGWEQGRRVPDGPSRVLLTVIAREPKAVLRALEAA
jgi:putative transcriptional regulator